VCVGKDDDVMEGEMDCSVTYMGVERKEPVLRVGIPRNIGAIELER